MYYDYQQLYKIYGNPDNHAFKNNLVSFRGIKVHKLLVPFLEDVFYLLEKQGINYQIKVAYGYCNRNIRGGNTKSMHAFGCAIDINPEKNPMGPRLITDMPVSFIKCWKQVGFNWGGDYSNRKDAMHFELINLELINKRMDLEKRVETLEEQFKKYFVDQVAKDKKQDKLIKRLLKKVRKLFKK